jgi:hypothetical protein
MKLRSLLLLAVGIGIGMSVSRRLRRDDPDIVVGPARSRAPSNPALHAVSVGAQAIGDRATVASLDAIRRARGAIRQRLAAQAYDDIAWN